MSFNMQPVRDNRHAAPAHTPALGAASAAAIAAASAAASSAALGGPAVQASPTRPAAPCQGVQPPPITHIAPNHTHRRRKTTLALRAKRATNPSALPLPTGTPAAQSDRTTREICATAPHIFRDFNSIHRHTTRTHANHSVCRAVANEQRQRQTSTCIVQHATARATHIG